MRPQVIYRYERSLPPRYAWLAHWPPWLAVKWAFTALVLNYMAMSFLVRPVQGRGSMLGSTALVPNYGPCPS